MFKSAKELKRILHYDPATGLFRWQVTQGKAVAGNIAGTLSNGYLVIRFNGKAHKAHRLAVLYQTGSLPKTKVDHKNRIRSDNRWVNLRPATDSQNTINSETSTRNTSGIKGVCWNSNAGKWHVKITASGKTRHLGYYADLDKAIRVRRRAERATHGKFSPTTAATISNRKVNNV